MRKTLWSALALAAILILAGCGEQSHTDGSGTDSATYTPDAGYTLGNTDVVQLNGFRAIDIEWVSGQVNVELYDGEGIQLSETLADGSAVNLPMEWQVCEDKGDLDIRSQPLTVSASQKKQLTVRLPRSTVLHELNIDAVSADVSVDLTEEDTLTLTELDVSSVSGTVSVHAANAGEISLETTSGAITGSVRTDKLEADSVSGSIGLTLETQPKELDVKNGSGDITLTLARQPEAVAIAYDKTVLRCHEFKWPYCNGILKKWHEAGLHTAQEIREKDHPPRVREEAPASGGDEVWKYVQQLHRDRG